MNKKGWWIFGKKKVAASTGDTKINRKKLLASAQAEIRLHFNNVVKWVEQGKTNSGSYNKMPDIIPKKVYYEQLHHDARDFIKGYVGNRDYLEEFDPKELGHDEVFIEILGGTHEGRDKWASKTHTTTNPGGPEMRSDFDMRFKKPTTHSWKSYHKTGMSWSFKKYFEIDIVPVINVKNKVVTYIALLYKYGFLKEKTEALNLKNLEKTLYGWVKNV